VRTRLTILAVCLLAVSVPLAAAPLTEKLPPEAMAYIGWAGKTAAFDGSMLGQMLNSPAAGNVLEALKAAIGKQIQGREEQEQLFESGWEMGLILPRHPLAVALYGPAPVDPQPRPGWARFLRGAILVDLGSDREAFDKHLTALLATAGDKLPLVEGSAGDLKYKALNTPGGIPVGFGYAGNVLFVFAGADMPAMLAAVTADKSLSADKKFAECLKAVSGDNEQLAYYVDATLLKDRLLKLAGPTSEPGAGAPPGGPSPAKIVDALGVGKVTALAGTWRIVDKGIYAKVRIFSPAPHQGLLMPFAAAPLTEADLAAVPQDADFFAAFKMSPSALYKEVRRVVGAIEPEADLKLGAGVAAVEQQLGLSITGDILEPLGDTWLLSSAPSQGGFITGTVLTVQVKDPAKLAAAVAKIEDFAKGQMGATSRAAAAESGDKEAAPIPMLHRRGPSIQAYRSGEAEIHYLTIGMLPVAPAWAIHKDRLYIAAWPQVIESAIAGPEKPIAQLEAFRSARARVAAKPSILCFANTPKILRQVYNFGLLGWTMVANMLPGEFGQSLKVEWLPPLTTLEKYLWPEITGVSADDEGITIESYGSIPAANLVMPLNSPMTVAILLPALGKARTEGKHSVSMANLNTMGKAIALYEAMHNDEKVPQDINELIEQSLVSANAFKSPISSRVIKKNAKGFVEGETDYVYVVLPVNADGGLIRMYERPENYGGRGANVLLVNGAVMWMDRAEFEKKLAETLKVGKEVKSFTPPAGAGKNSENF